MAEKGAMVKKETGASQTSSLGITERKQAENATREACEANHCRANI